MKKSIDLLKTALEGKIKGLVSAIYIGDPYILPDAVMPCLIINPVKTETSVFDNARDMHSHDVTISLVIDARQYFNATPDKMVGTEFLMNTMEGETSGSINANSVIGILRSNLTLDTNRFIDNISTVDYTTRRRTEDLITLEAIATLTIQYVVTRT